MTSKIQSFVYSVKTMFVIVEGRKEKGKEEGKGKREEKGKEKFFFWVVRIIQEGKGVRNNLYFCFYFF